MLPSNSILTSYGANPTYFFSEVNKTFKEHNPFSSSAETNFLRMDFVTQLDSSPGIKFESKSTSHLVWPTLAAAAATTATVAVEAFQVNPQVTKNSG